MHDSTAKKKTLSYVFAIALVLVLSAGLLFAFFGSANEPEGEIRGLGYQMISSDSLASETTSIRFVFTVGSLNYTRVGFVFSKTDPDPTVGGDGCHVYETTSVYSSIWANGVKTVAPDGRYWVAVKVTGIPNADFSTAIYVKPFVQDGSGVRYGDAEDICACAGFGHDISKGISAGRSQNSYRGLVRMNAGAKNARNYSQCDSLLIGSKCGAHTFPVIRSDNPTAIVEHEATTSKISEDQLFYCNQRGIGPEEAVGLIVNGYAREVLSRLPMEFAVEAQKLLQVSLEGSVG